MGSDHNEKNVKFLKYFFMKDYDIAFYFVGNELMGKKITHNDFVKIIEGIPVCVWADEVESENFLRECYLEDYGTEHPQMYCFFNMDNKENKEMTFGYNSWGGTISVKIWENYEENLKVVRNIARKLKCNVYGDKMIYEYKEGDEASMEKIDWEQIRQRALTKKPVINNFGESFGYKVFWFAIETEDAKSVIDTMGIKKAKRIGWKKGLNRAYEGDVFITPPIDGWVLVVGIDIDLPKSSDKKDSIVKLLNKLSLKFGEAQLLGSHRISTTMIWMLSKFGDLQRLYKVEDGENKINFGKPTEVEKQWDFIQKSEQIEKNGGEYPEDVEIPDEDTVLEIAGAWSVNPMEIEKYDDVRKYGYVGVLQIGGFNLFSLFG